MNWMIYVGVMLVMVLGVMMLADMITGGKAWDREN